MKLSSGHKFLKASDTPNGSLITVKNEGEWIISTRFKYPDGNPQQQFVIEVEYQGERRRLTLNKGNREILIKAWGNDTQVWVGKEMRLNIFLALVGSQKRQVFEVEPLIADKTLKETEETLDKQIDESIDFTQ